MSAYALHGDAEQIADYLGIDLVRARQVRDVIRGAHDAGYEAGYQDGYDEAEYTFNDGG